MTFGLGRVPYVTFSSSPIFETDTGVRWHHRFLDIGERALSLETSEPLDACSHGHYEVWEMSAVASYGIEYGRRLGFCYCRLLVLSDQIWS